MTYTELQSILPNDELHYITDCDVFFDENNINPETFFPLSEFILFEYTIDCFPQTIELLNKNNIHPSIHTDELDLSYIII